MPHHKNTELKSLLEAELPHFFLVLPQGNSICHSTQGWMGSLGFYPQESVMKCLNIPTRVRSEKAKQEPRTFIQPGGNECPSTAGLVRTTRGIWDSTFIWQWWSTPPPPNQECVTGCPMKSQDVHHHPTETRPAPPYIPNMMSPKESRRQNSFPSHPGRYQWRPVESQNFLFQPLLLSSSSKESFLSGINGGKWETWTLTPKWQLQGCPPPTFPSDRLRPNILKLC